MSSRPSRLRQLYYQWRMLKLPWRKTWLVGMLIFSNAQLKIAYGGSCLSLSFGLSPLRCTIQELIIDTGFDLSGNTFWEFKDQLNAQRLRRIVKYGRNTHYGDVNVSRKPPILFRTVKYAMTNTTTVQHNGFNGSDIHVLSHRRYWSNSMTYLVKSG